MRIQTPLFTFERGWNYLNRSNYTYLDVVPLHIEFKNWEWSGSLFYIQTNPKWNLDVLWMGDAVHWMWRKIKGKQTDP
jgi:hypothetical protein